MKKIIWFGIIGVGVFLRVFQFGQPVRPVYVDEASLGYNAYALLETGRDEYGKAGPLFLRSFGIYQAAGYAYTSTLPVKIFGLNEFSTRLASLVSGVILIILFGIVFGEMAAFVVAVSPVFLFYSRAAYEANLAFMFLVLGVMLATKYTQTTWRFLVGIVFVCFSAYTYHAERFVGVVGIILILWLVKKKTKKFIWGGVVAGTLLVPLFFIASTPGGTSRLRDVVSLESSGKPLKMAMGYLSPNNLFSKGDPDPQRSYPNMGVFYWWMFPLAIIGLIGLRKAHLTQPQKVIVLVGLISLIPGVITKDYFATVRVLPYFGVVAVLIAYGLKRFQPRVLMVSILIGVAVFEMYSAGTLLAHERGHAWGNYYANFVRKVGQLEDMPTIVDGQREKPLYILMAFYNRLDPQVVQRAHHLDLTDYYEDTHFVMPVLNKIEMRGISWETDLMKEQYLVADALAISQQQADEHRLVQVDTVSDVYGVPVLVIYKTQPRL